jgi:hypothetical protein
MEMDVLVYKQNMPMNNGESVNNYTRKLDIASRTHIIGKLNIAKGNGGAWTTEIYNDKVIMCVYKGEESNRYYLMKYSRDKDGTFNFGDMIEVERVTTYKPKTDMQITKTEDNLISSPNSEKACSSGHKTRKALGEPIEFNGWIETEKSFWTGVI